MLMFGAFFFMPEKLLEASKEYGPFMKINKYSLDEGTSGLLAPLVGLRFIHFMFIELGQILQDYIP